MSVEMPFARTMIAWTEDNSDGVVTAAFVGEGAVPGSYQDYPGRLPAFRYCSSVEQELKWIQDEAEELGVSVTWLDQPKSSG